jgi:outer membrane protein assembly complex protein YaeT
VNIDYGSRIRFGFRGNKQFSYRELLEFVTDVKEVASGGDYLDAVRRRIIDAYKDIGFVNLTINTLVREDPEKGIRYVSLIMSEGEKVRISSLKIEGIYSMEPADAEAKFSSFGSRLVQRHFYHEKGINKAAELFSDYLRSQGYLSAKLEFSKAIFSKDKSKVDVTLLFNEGIRTSVQEVKLAGIKSITRGAVLDLLGLKENEPFNIFKFEQGLVALKNKYQELGNLNMRIENEGSDSLVRYSKDAANVMINIEVEEGPVIHVGEILVRGNQQTHARVILRELPFITGDVLTKPILNETEDNLRKLNLFTSVVVRTIDHLGDETKKDILILVEESTPGSFEVAPGFRNDLGLRLGLGAAYQNVGGWDRSVSAQAVFNHRIVDYNFPEYDINLGFREPYLAEWPVIFTSNLEFLKHQYTNFDANIDKLTMSVRRELSKTVSVFLEYSYEQDNIQNAQYPYLPSDDKDSFIGALTPGFIYDTRNDTFNPTHGYYSINRFELATRGFGSEADIGYYRTTTSNTVYVPVVGDTTLALAVSLGWERSNVAGSAIPTFKLFRLGGISSLRGYDDDSVEVETSTTVNGTLGLANYRSEYRIPISGAFGTALFFDAGNLMIDRFAPFDLRSSTGVGLRYNTPVGPVALDVAWKLQSDAKVGDTIVPTGDRYKVHFAIGTF